MITVMGDPAASVHRDRELEVIALLRPNAEVPQWFVGESPPEFYVEMLKNGGLEHASTGTPCTQSTISEIPRISTLHVCVQMAVPSRIPLAARAHSLSRSNIVRIVPPDRHAHIVKFQKSREAREQEVRRFYGVNAMYITHVPRMSRDTNQSRCRCLPEVLLPVVAIPSWRVPHSESPEVHLVLDIGRDRSPA